MGIVMKNALRAFGLIFLMIPQIVLANDEAIKLLIKSEDFRGLGKQYTMKVKITDVNAGRQQQSEYDVSIKDNTTSLVEQTAPEKAKDRKMLMIKNDLWLYTPDIKKPIRISLAQKLTGEASNGDITKTDFLNDYSPELLEKNQKFIKLKLSSVNKDTTYAQIIYYISGVDFRPLKAEFLAQSGKQLKTAYYGQFKKIKNKTILTEVKIVDAIRNNKYSVIQYDKFESKKLDDSIFNKASF